MRKTKKLLLVALALVIVALAALAACEPKPETFSLTFDFGYDNLKEVVEIKEGEKAQPRTASRDGYVFKGWYKDAAFSEPWDFENASVSGNVTLYAKWAKLFTVRFVHNYPDAPADKVIQAEEGQKVQNYVPQREDGYLFDGWSLNSATLTDEFVPDETPIYSDLTVYAFWTRSYNVSFFDGFGNLIEVVPVAEGQAASQPRNVLYPDENLDTVFIFDSWDRDVSCVTEDMSVNATWFYSPTAGTDFYTYTLNESMTGYILSINTENAWMCSVLALPESYNGLPVVEIAQGGIPSGVGTDVLYIPGTIKVIDNGMIAGASATHVYLGEGVEKILMHAFVQASAKDFHLPASVKLIEPFAFRWTRNLSDFIIAQGSPFSFDKERQMLFSENGERLVFANHNGKTEIVIDDGIKYVGIGVFDWASSVEKVIIKAKGLIAEPSSFSNMQNLKEIVFEDGGWIKEARGIESPFVGEGTADTSVQGSFYRAAIEKFEFPHGLTHLGRASFIYCRLLTEIIVPDTLTYWGYGAFNNNENGTLSSIKMVDENGRTVTENQYYRIENGAVVEKGTGLDGGDTFVLYAQAAGEKGATYTVPSGVTSLQGYAFTGLINVRHVIFPEGIEELPGGLFCGIAENVYRDGQILYSSLEEVTLPSTLKRIRSNSDEYSTLGAFYTVEGTFRYARNLKKINWPTDCQIEEFENSAFLATGFEEFYIPASVKIIAPAVFSGADALARFTVSPDNTAYAAFDGALYDKNLQTLLIYPEGKTDEIFVGPTALKTVSESVFAYNKYIKEFRPQSLERIETSSFYAAYALETVVFPENFAFLGCGAFHSVMTLEAVFFTGEMAPHVEEGASGPFDYVYRINLHPYIAIIDGLALYVPENSFGEYYGAFYNHTSDSYDLDYSKIIGGYSAFSFDQSAQEWTVTVTEGVFRRVNETTGAVELVPVETEHTYIFMDGSFEYDVEIPLGAIAVDEMPVPRSRQGSYFQGWYFSDGGDTAWEGMSPIVFPLYGKGEITVYARWESERLIQNGESPVFGYEISETPETFVMTDSLLYFVMDAGVSGTYIFNVPESSTLFILDYDVFYSGVFNDLMDYDMYGNPLNRAYLREGKTYIIVVVDATVFNDDARIEISYTAPAGGAAASALAQNGSAAPQSATAGKENI